MTLGFQVGTVVRALKRTGGAKKGDVMKVVRIDPDGVCTLLSSEGTETVCALYNDLEPFMPLLEKYDVKKSKTEDVKETPPIEWVMMEADHGVARVMDMIKQTLFRHICLSGMCPAMLAISAGKDRVTLLKAVKPNELLFVPYSSKLVKLASDATVHTQQTNMNA